jgi:hypothetical protein
MPYLRIDIRTVLYLLCAGNLAAVVLLAGYRTRMGVERAYHYFLFGKLLQTLGWLLLGLRDSIPALLSVFLGNVFLISGITFDTMAFATTQARNRRREAAIAAVGAFGILAVLGFGATPTHRVALASTAILPLLATVCVVQLRLKPISRLTRLVAGAYGFFAIVMALRAIQAWRPGQNVTLMTSNSIQSLTYVLAFCLLLVGCIGFLLLLKEREDRILQETVTQLQQALAEVRTLEGFIPICASCKKIRDDKGFWNQIEAYISERTLAKFSHGICPECKDRWL